MESDSTTHPDQGTDRGEASGASYSWDASEYIFHQKGGLWYLGLWVLAALLCGVLAFFQQWLSIAVVVVMTLSIILVTRKQPRTLHYTLDGEGVHIENASTPYSGFKSYSVHQDVGWYAVDLEPAKRFVPRLTLHCENDDVATIDGILSGHLPRVDRELDWIERLTRYMRF